jgi:hypothetical protein
MNDRYLEDEELVEIVRELKSKMKYKEIQLLPDFQGVTISTLSHIYDGQVPTSPVLRDVLHLRPRAECGNCWRFNRYIKEATDDTRPRKRVINRWRDMPSGTIRLALEHREEV